MLAQHRLLFKAFGVSLTRTLRTRSKAPVASSCSGGDEKAFNSDDSSVLDVKAPAVQKIMERLAVVDRQLAAEKEVTTRLERRQVLIESHLSDLEEATNQMRGEMVETRRVLGEVALKQQNIDFLVKQTERIVLRIQEQVEAVSLGTASPPIPREGDEISAVRSDPAGEKMALKTSALSEEAIMDRVRKVVNEALSAWQATHPWAPDTSREEPPKVEPGGGSQCAPEGNPGGNITNNEGPASRPDLRARLESLELRLQEVQAEIGIQRVENIAVQSLCGLGSPLHSGVSQAQGASDSKAKGSGNKTALLNAELAQLLRSAGVLPFKDSSGLTRIVSQRVIVYDVPANVGAAEVRELCASAVGGGRGVISCVVRRLPALTAKTDVDLAKEHEVDMNNSNPMEKVKEAARYRSQKLRGEAAGKTNDAVSNKMETPVLRRAFEVTFSSAYLAAYAIARLNNSTLKSYAEQAPQRITVEPVVSADILAAYRRLSGDKKAAEDSSSSLKSGISDQSKACVSHDQEN